MQTVQAADIPHPRQNDNGSARARSENRCGAGTTRGCPEKLTGAAFPVGIRFQELDENPEVNEIPIIPKLMKAEGTLHEHCNLP